MRGQLRRLAGGIRRPWRWIAGGLALVVLLAFVVAFFIDEPLRRKVEREMNERLDGYTVTIRALDFHPIGLSLDLEDLVLVQNANPDPPVMNVKKLSASVQWWALLHGRLVANFELVKPTLHVNREHLRREAEDDVPVKDRGWQEALQAIYPLKINEFKITDGDVTYVEVGQAKPLRVSSIDAVARDIRNVRSKPDEYPSPLHAEAVVFDSGKLLIDGHVDFLRTPYAGVNGHIALERVTLDYFTPILARYNLYVSKGVLSGAGTVEYAPHIKTVQLDDVRVDGLKAEYHYRKRTAEVAKEVAKKTAATAKEVSNDPGLVLRAREVRATDATFAFVNKEARPEYRVFLADTNLSFRNFSNQKAEGTGVATLKGRFMGTGDTAVKATFRPETKSPDFDIDLRIDNTDMRAMNDMLRAHGKFDVVSGVFSFYSEIAVKNNRIEGYLKPLFRDLDVYDQTQDRDKKFSAKVKEKALDAIGKLLRNRPREEVATRADISGPVDDPKSDTLQVVIRLVQNAFFKAILPGFERRAASKGD